MKRALAEDDEKDYGPTEEEMAAALAEFEGNPDLGVSFYVVDPAAGGNHAYDRHTSEGIFERRAILSAHPTHVAIFDSEEAFYQALVDMPAERNAWYHPAGAAPGRYDAQVGNIHYQATLLGDTMSLNSCYPTDADHQWTRAEVTAALAGAADLAGFQQALNA